MSQCPCGLKTSYENCCGPFVRGEKKAPTAVALMRSRYAAYVKHEIDHVERTHAPESRSDFDRAAAQNWSEQTEWKGLEIKATELGGENDVEGSVEFVAKFKTNIPNQEPVEQSHHEQSFFRKEEGEWFYVDGKTVRAPATRSEPKIGRNDPCSCGSGKKFKKCHGA